MLEPGMQPRSFSLRMPGAFRPCLGPLLDKYNKHRAGRSDSCRWRAAAGLAAAGMAAAGGAFPPLNASLLSGAAGGKPRGSRDGGFGDPSRRLTDVLLVVNVALYGLQVLTQDGLTVWGIKINQLILAGQYWRLLTPAFLHGNLIHLAVNSASLNNLGPLLESDTGRGRFLAAYLVAAVAGNAASFFGSKVPSLGASGAIFGIGGAVAMYYYRNRGLYGKRSEMVLRQLYQTLLMNLAYGFMNPRIDNWGHIGGMLGGALAAFLLGPHYVVGRLPGQRGTFLMDRPPLPLLSSKPRQIKG